jgi:polysaccharide pyruvyl transferase WcaK-like protein
MRQPRRRVLARSHQIPSPAQTIAIWGDYHGGNFGDDLVVATLSEAIRRRDPYARLVGISLSPVDTEARHGIKAYPITPGASNLHVPPGQIPHPSELRQAAKRIPILRRLHGLARRSSSVAKELPFLIQSYQLLRGVDRIVVAGSGPFLDEWHGPWGHPYRMFRWAFLARLARVPMTYPSVGAGPIEHQLSAFFFRRAVAWSDGISVRDGHSATVLSSIGVSCQLPICPDMAFGLPEQFLAAGSHIRPGFRDRAIVGLNLMAHSDPRYWRRGDSRSFEVYVREMADFSCWLIDHGYRVRFFSSQLPADRLVAESVMSMIGEYAPPTGEFVESAFEDINEVEDLMRVVGECDVVLGVRYHSILVSLLLGVPVLALAYHEKTTELLTLVGRPDQCLDAHTVQLPALIAAFEAMGGSDTPAASEELHAAIEEQRRAVESQFDALFGPLRAVEDRDATS